MRSRYASGTKQVRSRCEAERLSYFSCYTYFLLQRLTYFLLQLLTYFLLQLHTNNHSPLTTHREGSVILRFRKCIHPPINLALVLVPPMQHGRKRRGVQSEEQDVRNGTSRRDVRNAGRADWRE